MSWKGDINNPVPNNVQRDTSVATETRTTKRAEDVRRDQDVSKNVTIQLLDIDTAIFSHIDKILNIHVLDNGTSIKVPIQYASPEKWKAIQKDGVLRDQQGKLQLPIIVFKRNSFAKDLSLMTPNRHLTFPVIKKFDEKNKYDKFSVLNNYSAPVHQVFGVTLPDHIDVIYEFNCWCEYIEQINTIVEKINFACEEYWGDPKRFKFRVYATEYSFTTENSSGEDRIVKAAFSLKVKAYLLEESFEDKKQTMSRALTPRVIKITAESVSSTQMDKLKAVAKKETQSPFDFHYTNESISGEGDMEAIRNFYENLISISYQNNSADDLVVYDDIWKSAPATSSSPGEEGWMAYDGNFHYIYTNGRWKRKSIADWSAF